MHTITLETNDPEIAEMIIGLAKKLKCKIILDPLQQPKSNAEEIIKIMKKIADRGTLAQAIPDPVAWQKEIRKDKPLIGREE